jgi:hypothetical protein
MNMEQAQAELTTLVDQRVFVQLQLGAVTIAVSGILGVGDDGENGTSFMVSIIGAIGASTIRFNCDNIEAIELCSPEVIRHLNIKARIWILPFNVNQLSQKNNED